MSFSEQVGYPFSAAKFVQTLISEDFPDLV